MPNYEFQKKTNYGERELLTSIGAGAEAKVEEPRGTAARRSRGAGSGRRRGDNCWRGARVAAGPRAEATTAGRGRAERVASISPVAGEREGRGRRRGSLAAGVEGRRVGEKMRRN